MGPAVRAQGVYMCIYIYIYIYIFIYVYTTCDKRFLQFLEGNQKQSGTLSTWQQQLANQQQQQSRKMIVWRRMETYNHS